MPFGYAQVEINLNMQLQSKQIWLWIYTGKRSVELYIVIFQVKHALMQAINFIIWIFLWAAFHPFITLEFQIVTTGKYSASSPACRDTRSLLFPTRCLSKGNKLLVWFQMYFSEIFIWQCSCQDFLHKSRPWFSDYRYEMEVLVLRAQMR